jgi:tetratricopeptide (TPR) repeat protein
METLRELLSIGKQYFESRQYSQAENHFRRIIDNGGKYADVFNMLGVISHAESRFSEAMKFFVEALKINPNYTEATLNLAVLYNDLGKYDDARKLYARINAGSKAGTAHIEPVLRGKLSNLHADIGDIYKSIGLYMQSVDEYRKALELNPGYIDIRTKLGQALREKGRLGDSEKELKTVIRANKKYAPALLELGMTYYVMKKIPAAKKSWKAAVAVDAGNELARMYMRLCNAMDERCQKPPKKKNRK